jgi:HAD superfamily hydrolase (TIGR01549 family)
VEVQGHGVTLPPGTDSAAADYRRVMDSPVALLDIDGTLVDSTYHHAIAWHRAFAAHDVDVPLWRVHRTIGMGGDKLVAEVAGDRVEAEHGDALRDRWQEEYAALLDDVAPLPGAADLVTDLHARGLLVVLASSGAARFSEHAVELLGVGDRVEAVTSSDDAEESKPEADILAVALDRVGGERAVVVGDTPYDVEAASRLGLACVGLLSGGYSRAELEESGAARVVESPADLVGVDWEPLVRTARR